MASKPKEVYKTIKRSISATTNGTLSRLSNNLHSSPSNGSTPTKRWIHPPDVLLNGRVEYSVKMLGKTEVAEPKGTHVVKDAIHAIRFHLQVNKGVTGHSGSKLRKVDIQISVNGLSVLDSKSRVILFKHPLHRISFCADDKQDKRVFSYIAKTDAMKHECFVFLSDKMAEKITLTIGEAFDLAYEQFIKKNGSRKELEDQKQLILLRKRVAELETENAKLKQLFSVNPEQRSTSNFTDLLLINSSNGLAPIIPNTPIPPVPTINATLKAYNGNIVIPIEPPPPHSSRRANPSGALPSDLLFSLNDVFNREQQGPDVGTRLQNLQMDRLEDLFDDEFDPRAGEKRQQAQEKARDIEQSKADTSKTTVEDFEALLKRVDERLAEMKDGFQSSNLDTGDTGDTGRDLEEQSGGQSGNGQTCAFSSNAEL